MTEERFYGSRLKTGLGFLGCLAFIVPGIAMPFFDEKWIGLGVLVVPVFGIGAVVFGLMFLRRPVLVVDGEGFHYRWLNRAETHAWADIAGFEVLDTAQLDGLPDPRFLVWTYKPGREPHVGKTDGMLPFSLPRSANHMAALMNARLEASRS